MVVSLAVLVVCLPPTGAEAQNSRAFGKAAPFTIEDLPPGLFRSQLAALPAAARARAMAWLHGFDFTEVDLPYLRADLDGGIYYADIFLPEPAPSAQEAPTPPITTRPN